MQARWQGGWSLQGPWQHEKIRLNPGFARADLWYIGQMTQRIFQLGTS